MKAMLIFSLWLVGLTSMVAQPSAPQLNPPSGKLQGKIVDAANQQPIEFATVSLLSLADSVTTYGTMTAADGSFLVEQIPLGAYSLHIDFLGYQSQTIERIEWSASKLQHDLGTIALTLAVENIATVEVTAEQNLMRMDIDRKVFDVEKSNLATGGTAVDVLRNIPTLDVDMDGNVSLRGSQGVTVLINGKPSSLTGANRKAVLDQIPASMIKNVEIITNPSAKYDPDGKAGIINIILKKNKLQGFSGNVSGSIGTLANKYNGTVGLNYRNERINLFSTYNFNSYVNWQSNESYRENRLGTLSYMSKSETGKEYNRNHFAKLGMDIFLNDKHSLSLVGSFTPGRSGSTTDIQYSNLNYAKDTVSTIHRLGGEEYRSYTGDVTLSYDGVFKHPEQKLSISTNYSHNAAPRGLGNFKQYQYDPEHALLSSFDQRLHYNNYNHLVDAQLDYTQPFDSIAAKLELGWNSTLRLVDNAFRSEYGDGAGNYTTDTTTTNRFNYNEQVHAGYVTFGQKIGKFSYQAGLRLEQVFTTSRLANTDSVYRNNYFSWYPSLHLTYELPKDQQLQLSYSRRVQRPFLEALNPFISYYDPFNIHTGNPYLRPEYTHSVQLEYGKYGQKGSISASIYYQYTTNVLRRIKELMPNGVSRVYYVNFDYNHSYGIELVASYNPFKWWRMQGSVNAFRLEESAVSINTNFKQQAIWSFVNFGTTFIIPKGFEFQLNVFYRSPLKLVLGKITHMTRLSLALSKTFLNKQLTVSIRLEDPFRWQQFGFKLGDENYRETGEYLWESRVAWLSISYNFGKMDMQTRRRLREGVRNGGGGGGGF